MTCRGLSTHQFFFPFVVISNFTLLPWIPFHSLYSIALHIWIKRTFCILSKRRRAGWNESLIKRKSVLWKIEKFATEMTFKSKHKVSHATTAFNPQSTLHYNCLWMASQMYSISPSTNIQHKTLKRRTSSHFVRCSLLLFMKQWTLEIQWPTLMKLRERIFLRFRFFVTEWNVHFFCTLYQRPTIKKNGMNWVWVAAVATAAWTSVQPNGFNRFANFSWIF